MKRRLPILILLTLLLSACGALPGDLSLAAATSTAVETRVTNIVDAPEVAFTPTAEVTDTPAPTATITPTRGPTATETFLPTLELSTLESFEPAFEIWDGQPTYIGDSQPGFFFRVKFDPRVWALTQDSYGAPALGHRTIEYCVLAPANAHGMTPGVQVEHDMRKIGEIYFDVNTALLSGVAQFVNYQGGDGVIYTGFQVNFNEKIDACLADAEAVLATLTSVRQSQATPVP